MMSCDVCGDKTAVLRVFERPDDSLFFLGEDCLESFDGDGL